MPPSPADAWAFLVPGYLLTVLIELPVLWFGLSREHSWKTRCAAGLWLTACTYPVVILVLPFTVWVNYGQAAYIVVAETFAPLAECLLFQAAYGAPGTWGRRPMWRDFAAIVAANLASFLTGEWLLG